MEIGNVIGVILGATLLILLELNKALTLNQFKGIDFFKKNLTPTLINILVGVIFIYAKEDLKDIYPITKFSCVILGFSGQALFKKIISIFDKNTETKIGINR